MNLKRIMTARRVMTNWGLFSYGVNRRQLSISIRRFDPQRSSMKKENPLPRNNAVELLDEARLLGAKKLSQSLEPKPKVKINSETNGVLEAAAIELIDDMNTALATNQLGNLFARVNDTSAVVEITNVLLNKDCSHADTSWSSDILIAFINSLKAKESLKCGELALAKRMVKNITEKLQSSEGKFRSHIIKTINFRRVPRIFFKPDQRVISSLLQIEERIQNR